MSQSLYHARAARQPVRSRPRATRRLPTHSAPHASAIPTRPVPAPLPQVRNSPARRGFGCGIGSDGHISGFGAGVGVGFGVGIGSSQGGGAFAWSGAVSAARKDSASTTPINAREPDILASEWDGTAHIVFIEGLTRTEVRLSAVVGRERAPGVHNSRSRRNRHANQPRSLLRAARNTPGETVAEP